MASLYAMRKFHDDGNIATAVADRKARRAARSRRALFSAT
jgi:hypothetical protein